MGAVRICARGLATVFAGIRTRLDGRKYVDDLKVDGQLNDH
jgi:hypothetical protein